jgi:hypothetical protein
MIEQHVAADMFQETQLHFQIVVLERQIFAWIGVAPPRLSTLCLATPTRLVSTAALPAPLFAGLLVQPSLLSCWVFCAGAGWA